MSYGHDSVAVNINSKCLNINLNQLNLIVPFKYLSIDKASKIVSLVLVIHGTDDEVIDMSHGIAIHDKCQKPVEPLWVEGAGHNDVEIYGQYVERLKRFINEEIRNHQFTVMASLHAQQAAAALAAATISNSNSATQTNITQTNQPTATEQKATTPT